jgi:hypothetical protein
MTCDIIPRIKNKEGEWVDSLLFKSLLDNFNNDRAEAIRVYQMVHSREFIGWFGDWINSPETSSKVVDENGEPMVVYHGTDKEFDEFKKNERKTWLEFKIENGLFFSKVKDGEAHSADEYGSIHMPVFLNIRKPELGGWTDTKKGIRRKNDSDGIIGSYLGEREGGSPMSDLERYYSKERAIEKYNKMLNMQGDNPVLVVFEPNQIKSIKNEGEFSKENDNIYYQIEGSKVKEQYRGKIIYAPSGTGKSFVSNDPAIIDGDNIVDSLIGSNASNRVEVLTSMSQKDKGN